MGIFDVFKGSEEVAIDVRNVTCRYGEDTILRDISFKVYRGEIFVILGGSGCGKSTLLKHIIGLYAPAEGDILIQGRSIVKASSRERLEIQKSFGVLYQSGALFGSMTLAENIALPLQEYTKLSPEAINLMVRLKLKLVRLTGFENHIPSEISGGMKKRAGLARAMALDPQILFFDEPSAGLDPITSAEMDDLILQINESLGTTMVIVTHELPSIFKIAKRIIMLDKATQGIVAEGDPHELKDSSEDPLVRDFFNRKAVR
jgi:phospholipid/cholesterol/gamma-HCH transport system ATP-binding protein